MCRNRYDSDLWRFMGRPSTLKCFGSANIINRLAFTDICLGCD